MVKDGSIATLYKEYLAKGTFPSDATNKTTKTPT
jgi:hypothetical protein